MTATQSITIHRSPGWLTAEQRSSELDSTAAHGRLTRANAPHNVRQARRGADVYTLADLPCGLHEVEELTDRVGAMLQLHDAVWDHAVDEEEVETILSEFGPEWSRRGERWVIPAGTCRPELSVEVVGGGVRSSARIVPLDDAEQESLDAVAEFVLRAHAVVRFARLERIDQDVVAASYAAADRLECELPHSLKATMAACQLVASEVKALVSPDLARSYLAFVRQENSTSAGRSRRLTVRV